MFYNKFTAQLKLNYAVMEICHKVLDILDNA